MALICDTGAIFALYDADDAAHEAVKSAVAAEAGPLLVPVLLLAEVDYLLSSRLAPAAAIDFLRSVEAGAFTLVPFESSDLARCLEVLERYRSLGPGLADASLVAAADRIGVRRVLTLDHRHFRAIRPLGFEAFVLLPADRDA
jgi:predicted nucleic acid-binding protein